MRIVGFIIVMAFVWMCFPLIGFLCRIIGPLLLCAGIAACIIHLLASPRSNG